MRGPALRLNATPSKSTPAGERPRVVDPLVLSATANASQMSWQSWATGLTGASCHAASVFRTYGRAMFWWRWAWMTPRTSIGQKRQVVSLDLAP